MAPPCCSITVRHSDKPSPMPSVLVVKNGVNSRRATSGAMPGPASITENTTQRLWAPGISRTRSVSTRAACRVLSSMA